MRTIQLVPQAIELQETQQEQKLDLPVILKDKILLSPGEWNGFMFTEDSIKEGFNLTDWEDKQNISLIYDHDERAVNWLGWVKNVRVDNGTLLGDLEVWDEDLARKLKLAGAKLGISARVLGIEDESGNFSIRSFANFSVVYDPACKNAFINLSEQKMSEKIKELEERIENLEGVTGSNTVQGSNVGANTNEKIKNDPVKRKKDEKKKEKVSMDEDEEEEEMNVHPDKKKKKKKMDNEKSQSSHKGESELNDKETQMTEEENNKEQSEESQSEESTESQEESKEESGEEKSEGLSSKLDLVLGELKKISDRVAKLEESEQPSEEEKSEETSEENSEENSQEEKSEELSKKEKDVRPLSSGTTMKLPKYGNYTQRDAEFVEALLSQAR